MATLIPALGSCAGRMQSGERRLAERLAKFGEDDCRLVGHVHTPQADLHQIRGSASRLIQRFSITE